MGSAGDLAPLSQALATQLPTPGILGRIAPGSCDVSSAGVDSMAFTVGAVSVLGVGHAKIRVNGHDVDSAQAEFGAAAAACYERSAAQFSESLSGQFALAVVDKNRHTALICADRFATFPLYWAAHDNVFCFGSNPAQVARNVGLAPALDPTALLAYLHFHCIPAPWSVCQGVQRLDIGYEVHWSDGQANARRYVNPQFDVRGSSRSDAKSRFFDSVRAGVADCVGETRPDELGFFLSGGTDSSTLAGVGAQVLEGSPRTFSIVFDEPRYDEREFSRCAASHFGCDHTETTVRAGDIESVIHHIARTYEQPFGNSSAVPTYICANVAAQNGVTRMIGGDGGDELFGGNSRYAKAWLLSLYTRLPAPVRRQLLEPLAQKQWVADSTLWPLRKFTGYLDQALVPLPDQLHARYNLLHRLGIGNVLSNNFIDQCDLTMPGALEQQVWDRSDTDDALVNRLLAYDFKFILGDNDLPKVTRMCHSAGVSVAFPMLHDAVVNFAAALAPSDKTRGMQLRPLFRQSLRGFVPDLILDKKKHGFGMPFGEWLFSEPALNQLAFGSLRDLVERGFLKSSFVTQIEAMVKQSGHAGYYGTMIWVLMMLELWLKQSSFSDASWGRTHL